MAAYTLNTFRDLQDAIMEELKVQGSDTVTRNRIKRDINMAYLYEVVPAYKWPWLRKSINVQTTPTFFLGTAAVQSNEEEVTLTEAPATSRKGHYFAVNEFAERYLIKSHTAGSFTFILERPYMGVTNPEARYTIWTNKILLPSDMRETFEVTNDFFQETLKPLGIQDFLQTEAVNPRQDGRPEFYSTTDFFDPNDNTSISGLPSVTDRQSTGYVKTITFGSSVESFFEENDRIRITGAGHQSYNGDFKVTSVSGMTMSYISNLPLSESTTADTGITISEVNTEKTSEMMRQMLVYPCFAPTKSTLQVHGIQEARPLENDTDEPFLPREDRIVLLYGGLVRAWSRERNPEEAARNIALFQGKLGTMKSKMEDGVDAFKLVVDKDYLRVKRSVLPVNKFYRS